MAPGFLYIVAAAAFAQVPDIGAVRETEGPKVTPPQVVVAAANQPVIHPRAEWDPNPPPAPTGRVPSRTRIAIHHSGNPIELETFALAAGSPESLEAARQKLRFELQVHRKRMGWQDIAYHYLVDAEGRIWEGRPQSGPGVSVAVLGHWGRRPRNQAETESRKKQGQGLEELLIWLSATHRIRPTSILSHREYEETTCPGDFLSAPVREARARIRASLAAAPAQARNQAPVLRNQGAGNTATGLGQQTQTGNLDRAFDNSRVAKPGSFFEVPADPNLARAIGTRAPAGPTAPAAPPAPAAANPAALDDGRYKIPFQSQEWPGVRRGGGWGARREYGGHTGLDLQADAGTPVVASRPGRVVYIDKKYTSAYMKTAAGRSGYGNRVVVEHPDGTETWYCHLQSGSVGVKVGDVVTRETQLGRVGNTGHSSGPHLHFMVMTADGDPTNPAVALGREAPRKPKAVTLVAQKTVPARARRVND